MDFFFDMFVGFFYLFVMSFLVGLFVESFMKFVEFLLNCFLLNSYLCMF